MSIVKIIIFSLAIFFGLRLFFVLYSYFKKTFKQKIVLVVGDTGTGKTSKVVADTITFYKRLDKFAQKQLEPIYKDFKNNGYPLIEMPDTLVVSDIDMSLKGKLNDENNPDKPNKFEFSDLPSLVVKEDGKLKIDFSKKKYLSIGSYGVFDEIANKVDARNFAQLDDGMSALLRLHRKAYYNFVFIYPNFTDADLRIRQNCHEIQKVIKMTNFKIPFTEKIIASRWEYVSYTGLHKQTDCENGKKPLKFTSFFRKLFGFKSDIEWRSKWFLGNIFKHYESRSEIAYFMKGLNKYKLTKQVPFSYSRGYVDWYCKTHPAYMPDNKKRLNKREKEEIKREKEKEEKEKCKAKKTKSKSKKD